MSRFNIERRAVGEGEPVLVIAEIGVNHDGSFARATELVRSAADAGADVVKFQIFSADRLVHPSARLAGYQQSHAASSGPADMLRRYELPPLEVAQLIEIARGHGLTPLATPFSTDDVATIEHLCLPAIKIASPDLINRVLLERCARLGRPMLVSTGAASMEEVGQCVSWLTEWRVRFALLHCVSAYPTPAEQAHLGWISELARQFAVPVGYSDHTTDLISGALAVAAGACIVERHLTYDKTASGPDHAASSDPDEFADYVRLIRHAERMRGRAGKRVLPIEQDVRAVSRQSLVLRRDLDTGERLGERDLIVQRPGTGILAADAGRAVGRRARKPLQTGTILQWDMLSDAA